MKGKLNLRWFYVFIIFILCIIYILNSEKKNADTEIILPLLLLLFFLFYVFSFYKKDYRFILSSFYQMYYYLGMIISSVIITSGSYMYEIQQQGWANGLPWVAVSFSVLCIESSYIGYRCIKFKISVSHENIIQKLFVFFLISVATILSLYILMRYGSPLFHGVNRVKYWGLIAPSYLSPIRLLLVFSFYVGVLYFFYCKIKAKSLISIRLILLFHVLMVPILLGEKVSVFIMFIFSSLMVSSVWIHKDQANKLIKIVVLIVFMLVVIAAIVYQQMGLGHDFVFKRIALQGQVLWSVLNENNSNLIYGLLSESRYNITNLFNGRDFVAERYLPFNTYRLNQETGTSLSGFSPAIQILMFGVPLTVFICFCFFVVLGFVQKITLLSIAHFDFIRAFLLFIIYFFMISIWFVVNLNLLAPLCLFIISAFFSYSFYKRKENV